MSRAPRDPKESLFGKRLMILSIMQGIFSLVVVMAVFKIALSYGQSEPAARSLAFATLLVSNICLILTNRSWSRSIVASLFVVNKALVGVVIGAAIFLALAIYVPFLQKLFHFGPLHPADYAVFIAAGICSVVWFELVKWIMQKLGVDLMRE